MSWLFSQALVAAYSAARCSAGEPSSPSSANPMPQAYLHSDRMTAFSRLSRFGMTFAPLTACRGTELLTSYLAGFPVKTFRPPAKARESTANAHRSLWDEGLSVCSLTLPKWGSMRAGVLSELLTLEHRTAESDAGLWPTPKANDAEKRGNFDVTNRRNGLPAAVKSWPTPVAAMSKGSSPAALTRKSGADRSNCRLDHAVMALDGGQLNPTWVEWLMGWPPGWTDLKPLATDKYRQWQQVHSGFCQE